MSVKAPLKISSEMAFQFLDLGKTARLLDQKVAFIGCKPLVSAPAGFTHLGPSVATAALSFWSCSLVQPRPVDSLFFTMGKTECRQLLDQSAGNSLC